VTPDRRLAPLLAIPDCRLPTADCRLPFPIHLVAVADQPFCRRLSRATLESRAARKVLSMKTLFTSLAAIAALLLPVAPAAAVETGTPAWSIAAATLFEGPGAEYDVVGDVDGKVRIYVERCSDRWCRIRAGGAHGWLSEDQVSFGRAPVGPFGGPQLNYKHGGPGTVCFYEGHDYSGASFCGDSGFVVHDLLLYHLDNRFSSVTIEGNVAVMACRDRDFKSYCERIDYSTPALQGFLDNGVSSLRVY
jgi:hypothetical protein